MDHVRHIALAGAPNLRDLGGYPTAAGTPIAYGRLYRSGELTRLTDADLSVVVDLNLSTVIDMRVDDEVRHNGVDRIPEGVAFAHVPIKGGDLARFVTAATTGDHALLHEVFGDGRAQRALVDINRAFVANADERTQFAAALRIIADADRHPVLIHCTAGKDRTGWLAAIVLTIMGVPAEAVMADYMLSNKYYMPIMTRILEMLSRYSIDSRLVTPLLKQHPSYLQAAFDEADFRYGSFDAFLHKGLDLDAATIQRLRQTLAG